MPDCIAGLEWNVVFSMKWMDKILPTGFSEKAILDYQAESAAAKFAVDRGLSTQAEDLPKVLQLWAKQSNIQVTQETAVRRASTRSGVISGYTEKMRKQHAEVLHHL
jgi:hypothetical protein